MSSDARSDAADTGRSRGASRPAPVGFFSPTSYPHLYDLLRVLSKRRWVAFLSFVVVVAGAVAYNYTATPIYEARVQLQIDSDRPKVVVFEQALESDSEKQEYQQTQVMILQSRALARRTIDALRLWNYPEFVGEVNARAVASRVRGVRDAAVNLGTWIVQRFTKVDPDDDANHKGAADDVNETSLQARAINAFLTRLTVTPIRNSRLVDVQFQSEDPKIAELIANTLVKAYVAQNLEFKSAASKDASEWLTKQLEEQRRHVDASQNALQRYRERTDAVSTDGSMQKLNELNAALTRAKTDRIQKESVDKQVTDAQKDPGALDVLPVILGNGFIQNLKTELANLQRQEAQTRETLGERHPEMVKLRRAVEAAEARLAAEKEKAVLAVHNDFLSAQALEASLVQALDSQKRDILEMNRKSIEGNVLERNAKSDREIFEALLQRTKEAGVSGDIPAGNIRIVDAADTPRVPISPKKQRNLLMSIVAGLVLSIGSAFFCEYLDKGIKSPDEVKAQLGLNCLGLVPLVATDHEGVGVPLVTNGVSPIFREAFRTVRTNVIFASTGETSQILLVTSTGPHEGKTVVAANLAIALAQTGQKVLLMDADLRRPRVHSVFTLTQTPGLSELAAGVVDVKDAIRESEVPRLWVLTAGVEPPNASELLSSPQFKKFVSALGAAFHWVIIDSPPVMAVTDASVLANIAAGVLFVVGAEQTVTRTALNALEQLDAARARYVGAVLNRVDLERNAFFYSYYYRPEYTDYYSRPNAS